MESELKLTKDEGWQQEINKQQQGWLKKKSGRKDSGHIRIAATYLALKIKLSFAFPIMSIIPTPT